MPDNGTRHVVTVTAGSRDALRALATKGLDLFTATARDTAGGAAIEGRIGPDAVDALRADGYEVTVHPEVDTPDLAIAADGVPVGYQQSFQLLRAVRDYGTTLPGIASVVELPERSVAGTKILALRLRGGTAQNRQGVVLLGGVHARELATPELLDNWMFRMCYSLSSGTTMNYRGVTYGPDITRMIADNLDVFVVPLVNPDGRDHVMSTDRWWRKNRAALPVDLNRNYDFLFDSGIGTSTDPASEVYRGQYPFSEPETRNVRWLLDTFPHITGVLDVHSFGELILYPWGDDNNQSTDPGQNFRVPNPDRGVPNDDRYREYIPQADQDWFVHTGNRLRDIMTKARGRLYTLQQSVGLYPTTGTVDDYSFARHFLDGSRRNVRVMVLETGQNPVGGDVLGAFQPPYSEVIDMRDEVGPAIMEFLLQVMCSGSADALLLAEAEAALERHLPADGPARDLYTGLKAHRPAIMSALGADPRSRVVATRSIKDLLAADGSTLDQDTADKLARVATTLIDAVPEAGDALRAFADLVTGSVGKSLADALATGQERRSR